MNHEEFTVLSKVQTTLAFYSKNIEPQYMAQDNPKEVFVERWLAVNKKDIVKANMFDIASASHELTIKDCYKADLERIKAENNRLQQQAEQWETKFKAANSSWQEEKHMAESWKADYYQASKQAEQVVPLTQKVSDLEAEIVRLKARLFDMLEQQSA